MSAMAEDMPVDAPNAAAASDNATDNNDQEKVDADGGAGGEEEGELEKQNGTENTDRWKKRKKEEGFE